MTVASAGFDDAKRHFWIFGQSRRQHAAGGTAADSDDIEFRIETRLRIKTFWLPDLLLPQRIVADGWSGWLASCSTGSSAAPCADDC